MDETLTLEFDGGSRGNPGPAGIGVVIRAADGTPLVTLGRFLGRCTNNVAEYRALITAMQEAKKLGAKKILIRGDSELIIKQMNGQYRVKHPDMKVLYEEAQDLIHQFDQAQILHNLRHKNELADKLANLAMDRLQDVTDADESPLDAPAAEPTKPGARFACPKCGCTITVDNPSPIRPHQLKPFLCQCGTKMNADDRG
jgi:ribonuclease HI